MRPWYPHRVTSNRRTPAKPARRVTRRDGANNRAQLTSGIRAVRSCWRAARGDEHGAIFNAAADSKRARKIGLT